MYRGVLKMAREEPGRLQLLCANCHQTKTRMESRGWGTYFEEYTGMDPLTATVL